MRCNSIFFFQLAVFLKHPRKNRYRTKRSQCANLCCVFQNTICQLHCLLHQLFLAGHRLKCLRMHKYRIQKNHNCLHHKCNRHFYNNRTDQSPNPLSRTSLLHSSTSFRISSSLPSKEPCTISGFPPPLPPNFSFNRFENIRVSQLLLPIT